MPYFAEETLSAIRAIPLYEIVRPYVELKRSGRNWQGLSPFSQERTPSFFVLTDKNYFKCFSSGLAGDGIRFVQELEKLTFPEALEFLAERFQIPVKYADGAGPDPELRSKRQALFDIHEYARDYFHREFMAANAEAEAVRAYWTDQRGFDLKWAGEFQIGFAPLSSARLLRLLKDKGFAYEALADCGLFHAGRSRDPATWLPLFRGRLMIPIRDLQGNVIAFTARQLDLTPQDHPSARAKYINSPETLIFHKGGMLFNLDRAKEAVKTSGRLLLVEGQLDALRCVAVGLAEAVAPQGTAITDGQLSLMQRYCDRLDVLLDSDEAGQRAVLRLLPMAFKAGMQVGVWQLPQGADPDDFLRAKGAAGLETLPYLSGIRFAGAALLPPQPTPEGRAKALEACFRILAACPSAVVREGYLGDAIAATGVSPAAARTDFARFFAQVAATPPARPVANPRPKPTIAGGLLTNAEGDLLWAVLQSVQWAEKLAHVVDNQWIRTSSTEGSLLIRILNTATLDPIDSVDEIYAELESDEERACFARYRVEERPHADIAETVNKAVEFLYKNYCRRRVTEIHSTIGQLSTSAVNEERIAACVEEAAEWNRKRLHGPFPIVDAPAAVPNREP